tara:strand:- start:20885 stop:22867 length:1983 start_codon:yes stop_codon:yes gene_type:complete
MGSDNLQKDHTSSAADDDVTSLRAEMDALRATLRDRELVLDTIAETTSEMIWRTDAKHRFTYMSKAVEKAGGIAMSAQIGKTRMELACDDLGAPKWRAHIDDLTAYRPFKGFRYTRSWPNGAERVITTTGEPVFDSDGTFSSYIGTAADITDQILTEARMESAQSSLMAAINALNALFSMWDCDGRLILFNEEFGHLNVAVSESSYLGVLFVDHFQQLINKGQIRSVNGHKTNLLAERMSLFETPGRPFEVERQDGRTILINEAKLADGSTIVMASEITAQKKVEHALRQSEQRLRDFGSIAADWFWEMDTDLQFTYMSDTIEKILGMPAAEMYGRTRIDLLPENFDAEEIAAHEAALLCRKAFQDFRYHRWHTNGDQCEMSISGKPIFDDAGAFQGYRGVGRDITQLVKAERALREEKERAEEASRAKSQFLAHMSHELRTPLNAILGFSDIIREQAFGPDGRDSYIDYANDIYVSGEHLLSLINDLLDLSKIEAGKFTLHEERLDLEELMAQSEKLFAGRIEDRNISINGTIEAEARYLYADRRAISQVLFNVLSNAEKFNRDGGRITTDVCLQDDGGICVCVLDTGVGFAVDEIKTAMTPFGRIENPLTRNVPGTGLGLPIVDALVELHGGKITITSEIGVGTTVKMHFPPARTCAS